MALLTAGKREGHENSQNGDYDEKFDQGKSAGGFHGRMFFGNVDRAGPWIKHFLATAAGIREKGLWYVNSNRRVEAQARTISRGAILKLLAARALDKVELSESLGLPPDKRSVLRDVLRDMERDGEVARIRKDRYVIPREADLFTGVIQFHASGAAHVLNEKAGDADLYISSGKHLDRHAWRSGRGSDRPGETVLRPTGRPTRRAPQPSARDGSSAS